MFLAHEKPSQRIVFLEKLVEKGKEFKERKYVMNINKFPWDYAWVTWAFPMETLLISSIENKDDGVTCYVPKVPQIPKLNVKDGRIFGPGWLRYEFNTEALNSKYFSLPQKTPYKMLGNTIFMESGKDYDYYLERIAKDEVWMKWIKEKALELNITTDSSLAIDARIWAEKNGY
jgi:hypothetical protein